MAKGAEYEREVCKLLSLWLSGGKDDDWLWRSSQSGGRATQRAKSGKKTSGHCSDIAATDPRGQWLVDLVAIEIKRGYNGKPNNTIYDLIDLWRTTPPKVVTVIDFIQQARSAQKRAGVKYWAVIHRKDNREPVIYSTADFYTDMKTRMMDVPHLILKLPGKKSIVLIQLDDFLKNTKPRK